MSTQVRISKLLSEQGICSRREADRFIENGWILVDGNVARLGQKVDSTAQIELTSEALKALNKNETILLNKPVGYVSNLPEKGYRDSKELLTLDNQFNSKEGKKVDPQRLKGLAVAGRLDIDSQGLLIFTQSGKIAKELIGENTEIEKEYLVRVEGLLSDEGLAKLRHGIILDGKPLKPAKVEWINKDQLRFVLREGKKRQIRRMCDEVGLSVKGLKRVRIGKLMLGDLPEGQWRLLRPNEKFK